MLYTHFNTVRHGLRAPLRKPWGAVKVIFLVCPQNPMFGRCTSKSAAASGWVEGETALASLD